MSPSNGNSYRADAEQCLAQAELAASPEVAAIWRSIADQYRLLEALDGTLSSVPSKRPD
jgi:hypothetical protein